MTYLLDTNACIHYLNHADSPIRCRMELLRPVDVMVCSVVKAKLYYGANRSSRKPETLTALEAFLSLLSSLPFDDNAARVYGRIRAELSSRGTPIGPNDLMIASIALAHNIALVTHNTREFGRVDGLRIEDWQGSNSLTGVS